MAKWAITYNGFGTEGASTAYQWNHTHINSHSSEPVYGDDGVSIETIRHQINGTALLSANTDSALRTLILNARERLSQPLKIADANSFRVYLDFTSSTGTNEVATGTHSADSVPGVNAQIDTEQDVVVYYGSEKDDYGIPTCRFDINEISGTKTAIVSYTFTWHKLEPPSGSVDWDIVHHSWTQAYDIDENGLTTITIEGDLKVRNWKDGGQDYGAGTTTRGTNPDRYRSLVMPSVPHNFRTQNMNWATDRTGNRLIYRITLKEHARPLPYPAKTGSGRFSYHREMGEGWMGIKVFDAELEGDTNTDPRSLLNTLIRVAATRIMFGGSVGSPQDPVKNDTVDQVLSITVVEHDIFSKKKIGLRIMAKGLQTTSAVGLDNDPNGPQGPGFNMLDSFFDSTDELALAERPNVYGTSLIQSIKKQMFLPWNPADESNWTETNVPRAKWRRADEWSGEDVSLVVDESVLSEESPPVVGGGENATADIQSTEHARAPYTFVSGNERVSSSSNIVVMSGQSLKSVDTAYQVGKPVVTIESEYRISRIHEPPKRLMMSKPANAIVLAESFDVNKGEIDANNNNTYNAVYRRTVRLLDNASASGFYTTKIFLPGYGSVDIRAWWPSSGALNLPADPRVETQNDQAGSIDRDIFTFERDLSAPKSWSLGDAPPVYGRDV